MKTFSIHFAARCGAAVLLLLSGLAHAQSDPGMSKSPDGANAGAAPSMGAPKDPGSVKVPPPTGTEEMVTKPKNVDPGIAGSTGKIDAKAGKKRRRNPSATSTAGKTGSRRQNEGATNHAPRRSADSLRRTSWQLCMACWPNSGLKRLTCIPEAKGMRRRNG